jgi:Flp pilus assembly pilin Flp
MLSRFRHFLWIQAFNAHFLLFCPGAMGKVRGIKVKAKNPNLFLIKLSETIGLCSLIGIILMFQRFCLSFAKSDGGTTAVEYAMLGALLSIMVLAGVNMTGETLETTVVNSGSVMDQAALAGSGGETTDPGNGNGNGNGNGDDSPGNGNGNGNDNPGNGNGNGPN